MKEPCRRLVGFEEIVNSICTECNHNTAVHPGLYTNPELDVCLGCKVEINSDNISELVEVVHELTKQWGKHP